jgi:hypothetical protein
MSEEIKGEMRCPAEPSPLEKEVRLKILHTHDQNVLRLQEHNLTFAVVASTPNTLNVSYNRRSSTAGSRLPMNRLAPTSSCFLSEDAWD